jgi:ATP-dependent Clp protease ATP-binding subunit ClpB
MRITLDVTAGARRFIADQGFDPAYGARPLRRLVQASIGDPLARMLISGEVGDGGTVVVDHPAGSETDGLVLTATMSA